MVLFLNKILFFSSFLSAFVISVGGVEFDDQDFYSKYSKSEWVRSSFNQKTRILHDYIKRESAALDAVDRGYLYNPVLYKDLLNRKKQLLVNFVYDYSVAFPLVSKKTLLLAKKNLSTDVFIRHLLISHSESLLSSPPNTSKEEALLFLNSLRDSVVLDHALFNVFSKKYSDDPAAKSNGGVLGWLQWGVTPMSFQEPVWSLGVGDVSNIIETDYGFHLVVVDSTRSSEFAAYDSSSYGFAAFRSSLVSVRDLLGAASLSYDAEIIEARVLFYDSELLFLFDLIQTEKKALSVSGQRFNFFQFISSLDSRIVVCRVDNSFFGLKWFLSSLSQIPNSNIPDFDGVESLLQFLKVMVMQKIAVFDGETLALSDRPFFKKRVAVEKSKLLYNALLKDLVNTVPSPDSLAVLKYYDDFKNLKYYDPERVLVRQIKVNTKVLADSLFAAVSQDPSSFESLATVFSTNRGAVGGLMEPFEKGKYNYMGEAAFGLFVGEIAGPIENLDRSFSVILLEDIIPGKPIPLGRVYKRIESLLLKEYQEQIKKDTFNGYINNPNLIIGSNYEKFFN